MLGRNVRNNEKWILKSEFRDPIISWRYAEEIMYNRECDSEYLECGSWEVYSSRTSAKCHKESIR